MEVKFVLGKSNNNLLEDADRELKDVLRLNNDMKDANMAWK